MLSHFSSLADGSSGGGIAIVFMALIYVAVIVLIFAGLWKLYVKAGHPGWEGIVPIYNIYILTKIVGKEWWWMLLCLIPFVGWIFGIILIVDLARVFGKGIGYAIGMVLLAPIFIPMLGFGDAKYLGPVGPSRWIPSDAAAAGVTFVASSAAK